MVCFPGIARATLPENSYIQTDRNRRRLNPIETDKNRYKREVKYPGYGQNQKLSVVL